MKYNFGEIHTAFVTNFKKLNESKDGRKVIKEYINIVKKNDLLIKEHEIFEEIPNSELKNPEQASTIIIETIKKYNNLNIVEVNKKLVDLLENSNIGIEKIDNEYYNSVHYLLTVTNPLKNINEICESENIIKKHFNEKSLIKENETQVKVEDIDMLTSLLIEKFNKKYDTILNEDEKRLVKQILESKTYEEKKNVYEEYKTECLTMINESLKTNDMDVKEKLLSIKERLLNESFVEEDFENKINEYIELSQILKD